MQVYGSEDLELCLRIWLLGRRVVLVPSSVCSHLFRSKHPYEVPGTAYLVNMMRTALAHFSEERLQRCLDAWKDSPDYDAAFAQVQDSDIWERRRHLFAVRTRDDDWFFRRFKLSF
jgi:hypothetical protein